MFCCGVKKSPFALPKNRNPIQRPANVLDFTNACTIERFLSTDRQINPMFIFIVSKHEKYLLNLQKKSSNKKLSPWRA